MKYGALAADGDMKSISGATGKYAEHGSSSGGYKTQRREKGMTNLNNPECLSWTLGDECGNTSKVNLDGVGLGRRQR